jgi:purine catabolism regulator
MLDAMTGHSHTPVMAVTIQALAQAAELALRPLTTACQAPHRSISWVSTTELSDPRQFLRGDELVLTVGLHNRTPDQQREFVSHLANVSVAGMGYATGLIHETVPEAVTATAQELGLALFEVPLTTPFIAISNWVAERIYAEKYDELRRFTDAQDVLTRTLLAGLGLSPLLKRLRRIVDAPVAVIDRRGWVVDRAPSRCIWPDPADLRPSDDPAAPMSVLPVEVEGVVIAHLCAQRLPGSSPILSSAVGLIGLELARRQAILTGRREMLGQVLQDVIRREVSQDEAVRRLAQHGIDPAGRHRLLVGHVSTTPEALRRVPWSILDLLDDTPDKALSALVDDYVVLVLPAAVDPRPTAAASLDALSRLGRDAAVGIGGEHQGIAGLRMGFFEARQALTKGAGLHEVETLSLPGLLLSNADAPVRDIAETTLAPLFEHDAARGSRLIETLRTYLATGCSPGDTARELVIHRNGLQYRLQRIEKLTARDLTSFDDRVHFWLALAALDMS